MENCLRMIETENIELATRTIEAFNALSVVLPLYDSEARSVFRAAFKMDMADLLPEFFKSLALIALKNEKEFNLYLNFFEELIRYMKQKRNKLPQPNNLDDSYFINMRESAEKLLKAWMIKEKK